jgi:MSHA biogenesis protein MshN
LSLELSSAPAVPQKLAELQPATAPAGARGAIPASRVLGRATDEPGPGATRETAADTVVAPPSSAETAVPKKAATTVAVAVEKAPPATSGKAQIEKEVRQPTQRDLADNEYRKGANSLHQGRLAEAQEGFRAALGLYPAHHGARQALVALLVESKAFAESERTLQEGIKLAPEQIGFATTLARLQVNRGDNAAAVATLQNVVNYAHGSADFVAFLAALLQRQARHEEAIEQFQAALRMKPNTGVWWLGLAMSLQALNRTPDAQEAYRRAKSTNNLNPELNAFAEQRLRQLQ